MNKCSPSAMRDNLRTVDCFKQAGIDFVAVPVRNEDEKDKMILAAKNSLDKMLDEAGE